jgi:hypothetical protein
MTVGKIKKKTNRRITSLFNIRYIDMDIQPASRKKEKVIDSQNNELLSPHHTNPIQLHESHVLSLMVTGLPKLV